MHALRQVSQALALGAALVSATLALQQAAASESRDAFVEANILAIFYHELGHAVIDQTDVIYWDVHGPDEQRYYNHICLFFGANPSEREEMANDLGLPEERAETCLEEYEQAADSWGAIFDEMDAAGPRIPIVFEAGSGVAAAGLNDLLLREIDSFNGDLNLQHKLIVRVENCGEANAFYDPGDASITMCLEFVPHLEALHSSLISE